jgi:hypothetical protein
MNVFWNILFASILLIIWIISAGYITRTSVLLNNYKNLDNNLNSAYWYAFSVAFLIWTLVIIAIIGIVLIFVFGPKIAEAASEALSTKVIASEESLETTAKGVSWGTLTFLIIALIIVFVTGVMSALIASNIGNSPHYDSNQGNLSLAYSDAIIAASLSLAASGVIIIGLIVYIVTKNKEKEVAIEKLQEYHGEEKKEKEEESDEYEEVLVRRKKPTTTSTTKTKQTRQLKPKTISKATKPSTTKVVKRQPVKKSVEK